MPSSSLDSCLHPSRNQHSLSQFYMHVQVQTILLSSVPGTQDMVVVKREHGALFEQMALQEINSANYGEAIFASHLAAHSELV